MPEYLAPGVYVEEVSFRSKSIDGVPTSTTGFAGMARYGPTSYPDGPLSIEPRLITSFTEFERVFGGLEQLQLDSGERDAFLAHAARAFFMNGGKRLYVARAFKSNGIDAGVASADIAVNGSTATVRARWPGAMGNVRVKITGVRGGNIARTESAGVQAKGAKAGAVVEITPSPGHRTGDPLNAAELAVVTYPTAGGPQTFVGQTSTVTPSSTDEIRLVELQVAVLVDDDRTDLYREIGTGASQKRYIGRILDREDPEDENAMIYLDWDATGRPDFDTALLMKGLTDAADIRLSGGNDGTLVPPTTAADGLLGREANPDVVTEKATGLAALGEIDDIAIVALPDASTYDDPDTRRTAVDGLIGHAETLRYRIAIVDGPAESSMTEIRQFRGQFDTKYAALYHPWVEILDPLERPAQGAPPRSKTLPPSGFVAGIYARSDIERGVHKAPANEVVRGLTKFEININKGRNDVLNPEGINALRFFEGRGNRVWGARTMSSDPEWKYVNVRRLFIYLEHSIDKATQWAVFEPNNDRLWANIRQSVEDFLFVQWKNGALLGRKPDEAYFVRCDRTTMSQNDLDNGRMICLIGVAPVYPAEFVIFRIGQWTADAKV
jgi:phage tail sheath protein FI